MIFSMNRAFSKEDKGEVGGRTVGVPATVVTVRAIRFQHFNSSKVYN